MEHQLSHSPRVQQQQHSHQSQSTEQEPGEVVHSEEAPLHSQRTVDLAVASEDGRALVLEKMRGMSSCILELHYQENDPC